MESGVNVGGGQTFRKKVSICGFPSIISPYSLVLTAANPAL